MKFTFDGKPKPVGVSEIKSYLDTLPDGTFITTKTLTEELGPVMSTLRHWVLNGDLDGYHIRPARTYYLASRKTVEAYNADQNK